MDELKKLSNDFYNLNKLCSDTYKQTMSIEKEANIAFEKLLLGLCEQYNLKIRHSPLQDFPNIDDKYKVCSEVRKEKYDLTQYNQDFEGEYQIVFVGNLTETELEEIKQVLDSTTLWVDEDENGFYFYYKFVFFFFDKFHTKFQKE